MADLKLKGKTALVTGSSSGIGAVTAAALAAEGCRVMVHGRSAERVEGIVDRIRTQGGAAQGVVGDLSAVEGIANVAAQCRDVDILVNNAGGAAGGFNRGFEDIPFADWMAVYASNTAGAAELARLLMPSMRERGWGRLIQIASATAVQPTPIGSHYAACKAAVINLSVSMARALAGTFVTANTISPGVIHTPNVQKLIDLKVSENGWEALSPPEQERRVAREVFGIEVARLGRCEDVAHAVLMLASPLGDFITGANIRVDGGHVQTIN